MEQQRQGVLKGKIDLRAILRLESGLHIGGGADFAPIGAVDSPFVRDPLTKQPIIPGSSLKGKIRTLLAKNMSTGYFLNPIDQDPDLIARLFGAAAKSSNSGRPSRLQFFDLPLTESSLQHLEKLELDTYIGEVKFENTINRLTSEANPRQIERVIAGAKFGVSIVYDVTDPAQVEEDLSLLAKGMKLLQMDYLGGHGSRGSGRVSLKNFALEGYGAQVDLSHLKSLFDEVDSYELFSV